MIISTQSAYTPPGELFASPASAGTVADTVEDMLELNGTRHRAFETLAGAVSDDAYLKTLARLLQAGIVGTETLDVGGRPYTRFASTAIVDTSHRGAAPYRSLDLRG